MEQAATKQGKKAATGGAADQFWGNWAPSVIQDEQIPLLQTIQVRPLPKQQVFRMR